MWHSGQPYKVLPSSAVVSRISPGFGRGFFSFGGFFFFFFFVVVDVFDDVLLLAFKPLPLFITLDPFELFAMLLWVWLTLFAEDVCIRLLFAEPDPLLWVCCCCCEFGGCEIGWCCCWDCDCIDGMWLCWFWFKIAAFDNKLELKEFNPKPCAKFWVCAISMFCECKPVIELIIISFSRIFFFWNIFTISFTFYCTLLTDSWFCDSFLMLSAEYLRKWCNDKLAGKCDK